MSYRYFICDVFTETRFGGNPLAVLPDARGLSAKQMQQIAREFNFSESTFVLPAEHGHTRRVRIFTPTAEVPFAGHPNVGTAFCLARAGEFGVLNEPGQALRIVFEEDAGPVAIDLRIRDDRSLYCELAAPAGLSVGRTFDTTLLAEAVSLGSDDIVTDAHAPVLASVGLPFIVAQVRDRETLARARSNMPAVETLRELGVMPDIHLYVLDGDEFDIRARMFAPLDGVPEDPATGSANCALAGLLANCDETTSGEFAWRIAQGVEMGRPSILQAAAVKKDDVVIETRIGGSSVMVSEGRIEV